MGWKEGQKKFHREGTWEVDKNCTITITLQYESPTFVKEMPYTDYRQWLRNKLPPP